MKDGADGATGRTGAIGSPKLVQPGPEKALYLWRNESWKSFNLRRSWEGRFFLECHHLHVSSGDLQRQSRVLFPDPPLQAASSPLSQGLELKPYTKKNIFLGLHKTKLFYNTRLLLNGERKLQCKLIDQKSDPKSFPLFLSFTITTCSGIRNLSLKRIKEHYLLAEVQSVLGKRREDIYLTDKEVNLCLHLRSQSQTYFLRFL